MPIRVLSAAVLIIFAVLALALLLGSGVRTISTSEAATLKPGTGVYFGIKGISGTAVLYLINSSNGTSAFYLSNYPILENPIKVFALRNGGIANVSTSASGTATLQIKLISASAAAADVELTPIPLGINLRQSSFISPIYPIAFYANSSATPSTSPTTIAATTTISQASTTTVQSQQSAPSVNITEAMQFANGTYIGIIMNDYRNLYLKAQNCTPPVYNSTLKIKTGENPNGPLSFYNISYTTPTDITWAVSGVSEYVYFVNYTTVTRSTQYNRVAVSLQLNDSAHTVLGVKFSGLYAGFNYTQLRNAYNFQSSIGNNCAAYIQ